MLVVPPSTLSRKPQKNYYHPYTFSASPEGLSTSSPAMAVPEIIMPPAQHTRPLTSTTSTYEPSMLSQRTASSSRTFAAPAFGRAPSFSSVFSFCRHRRSSHDSRSTSTSSAFDEAEGDFEKATRAEHSPYLYPTSRAYSTVDFEALEAATARSERRSQSQSRRQSTDKTVASSSADAATGAFTSLPTGKRIAKFFEMI